MQAFGMSKVLEVNEGKVTMVAGRRSRAPHLGAANMRRGQTQVRRGYQTSDWCVKAARLGRHRHAGRSGDHADTNSTRVRTTSLACSSGDGICKCDIMATVALQTEAFLRATPCLLLLSLPVFKIHAQLS